MRFVQVALFLNANRTAIAGLLDQAYQQVGGHYALMTPQQRRQQATIDSLEFIADLLRGGVDLAKVRQIAQQAANSSVEINDILRMVEVVEPLFIAFVRERVADDPALADELVRYARNTTASFRAKLMLVRIRSRRKRFSFD